MNFLQLVQRTRRECGISGTGPTSVLAQSGEMLRLVDWVREAYLDIQNAQPYWRWLNRSVTVPLLAGGQIYDPVTDWSTHPLRYETDSFSIYPTAEGSTNTSFLAFDDYATSRRTYLNPRVAKPTAFTELNTREIKFNTILDADYTLSFDHYSIAEELDSDLDVPSMPDQYHMAVVWKAVGFYADFEEVAYLQQRSELKFTRLYDQMLRTETLTMTMGGPLA